MDQHALHMHSEEIRGWAAKYCRANPLTIFQHILKGKKKIQHTTVKIPNILSYNINADLAIVSHFHIYLYLARL